mgnify:FL=1
MAASRNKIAEPPSICQRAENETRTRDPNLGKVVLYQLSYFRKKVTPIGFKPITF